MIKTMMPITIPPKMELIGPFYVYCIEYRHSEVAKGLMYEEAQDILKHHHWKKDKWHAGGEKCHHAHIGYAGSWDLRTNI